jgi:hypothetical protein
MTTIEGAKGGGSIDKGGEIHTGSDAPSTPASVVDASPMIPSPYSGFGDPVAAALAAVAKFAKEARELSRDLQKAQRAAQEAAERQGVAAMRDKADEIRTGAVIGAISLGVSTALSGAAFVSSLTSPSPSAIERARQGGSHAADRAATHGAYSRLFEAGSRSTATFAEIQEKAASGRAALCEADSMAAESRAKSAGSKAELFGDNAAQAEEIARKAADAIRAVADARHSAQLAIASIRG